MGISDVTVEYLIGYLRLDEATEIEISEVTQILSSATSYIKGYTGLSDEELDSHEDLVTALCVLVADMFDNRNMQIEKPLYNNKTVTSILDMHRTNLL